MRPKYGKSENENKTKKNFEKKNKTNNHENENENSERIKFNIRFHNKLLYVEDTNEGQVQVACHCPRRLDLMMMMMIISKQLN